MSHDYCKSRRSIESLSIWVSGNRRTFIFMTPPDPALSRTHTLLFLFFLRLYSLSVTLILYFISRSYLLLIIAPPYPTQMSHVRFFFCAHSFVSILYIILLSSSPTLPACLPSPRRWTTSKYCYKGNRWSIESLKIVISGNTITFMCSPCPLSLPLTHVLLFLFFLRLYITMWSSRT